MSLVEFQDLPNTTTPINAANLNSNFNELLNQIININTKIINLKGKILWSNQNITNNFPQQDIILSSSDYDVYEILYTSNNDTTLISTGKIKKGNGTVFNVAIGNSSDGPFNIFRSITYVNDTKLNIGVGLKAYASTRPLDDNICKPLYVIGYKIDLFNS